MVRYHMHPQSSAGLLLHSTVRTGVDKPLEVNLSMSSLGHGSSGQMDSEILFLQGVAGGTKRIHENSLRQNQFDAKTH